MTTPHHADERVTVYAGNCLNVLREVDDASIDAVCCDPPYGLEFMSKDWDAPWRDDPSIGKTWQTGMAQVEMKDGAKRLPRPTFEQRANVKCRNCDKWRVSSNPCRCETPDFPNMRAANMRAFGAWCEAWATECLRVLKPGGHMLAFGGTRTWHRLACAIEDAGFEVRDSIAWLYGSGFPKSLDVSKAIDKAAGAEREPDDYTGANHLNAVYGEGMGGGVTTQKGAPATDDARTWQGWGTALKPAFEPIVVARKPLVGTVAANVLAHGTGALNIDACRIGFASQADERESKDKNRHADFGTEPGGNAVYGDYSMIERKNYNPPGRWPANVVLDESQAAALDAMTGEQRDGVAGARTGKVNGYDGGWGAQPEHSATYGGQGGASRFFYTAKAPGTERVKLNGTAHPTVKPLDLMRWLVRLVTPPSGLVLDPFAGSGTTVEACILEGFRCIAIEREPDYLPLITQRVNRRIDPVAAVKATAEDGGLFDLLGDDAS